MGKENQKRQQPSVKRLKKRRKLLSAIKAKVEGGSALTDDESALYDQYLENKRNWDRCKIRP